MSEVQGGTSVAAPAAAEPSTAPVTETESHETETDESGEGSPSPEKKPAPKPKPKRTFKVKDGDNELDVDEDEVVRGYQRASAASRRFEEAAKMRRESEELIQGLLKDPRKILQHPSLVEKGFNFEKLAYDYVREQVQGEMVDPAERKALERERALEEREKEVAKWKAEREQERQAQAKDQAAQRFDKKFKDAFEKAGLPKSPYTVKRMAEYQRHALQNGYDLTAEELGEMVKQDATKDFTDMFGQADADTLYKLFGDKLATKIREADLKKLQGQPQAQQAAQGALKQQKGQEKISAFDFRENLRKQYGL